MIMMIGIIRQPPHPCRNSALPFANSIWAFSYSESLSEFCSFITSLFISITINDFIHVIYNFYNIPVRIQYKKFLFHHVTAITVFSPIFMKSKISIIVFIICTKGFPTYSFITVRVFKIMPFKINPYSCHSFCLRWSFVASVVFDSIVILEEVLYSK